MYNAKTPFLADWITLTVRWVFLISVSLSLMVSAGLIWSVVIALILAALGNIVCTAIVASNRGNPIYRLLTVIGDMVFAHLLFFVTARVGWIGVVPVVSAALYYRWVGVFLVIILNLFIQSWLALGFAPLQDVLVLIGMLAPLYIVTGIPLAYLGRRLKTNGFKDFQWPDWPVIPIRDGNDRPDRDRRRAIYKLITALSASLNYQRVLETSLDLSTNTLAELNAPAGELASAVLLFIESESVAPVLHVAASRRFSSADKRVNLPGTRGLIGQVIEEGEPRLSRSANKDRELINFVALQPCRAAYCIPLRTGLDTYGILLFAHPDADFFTPDRREVLDIVGNQAVVAIQNARLYQELEQEKERMMELQEQARKKMARDLHDGPTQSISAIAMRVNFARRLMERDAKAAAEELYKIEDLARRTTKEIRHMLFTLRPLVLESEGLIAALESMAEKMKETYNQEIIIQADPRAVVALEPGKQAVVFYIAEEAISNARKHAHADHIWVRLKMLRDSMSLLEIEDDGIGFDASSVDASYDSRGSLGMVNMRERSELVNGLLRIDSAEGRGTRIRLIIPLTEEAGDRIWRGK